ncbi:hypothetical protein [Streptomyces albireticuli]|uniref:Uncharacterized protein n=1 Tax=Streptomyces albireticuli TaxID=1940 RepID=A0A2A2DBR3_9ACTN|nr:hypothetical protein [Streptomyces albireticuli]MCD9145484.1 hypothetical protein [Streptomyces albireticuli]MCD9164951.1 hypothetical protein [Streptomyces albireticuli]MCD9195458.1 hypothetical protein [Streptomyces albireticuli]PAU48742.1 hypothetical protein CK936_11905 [Streptomyces albireticuli]
MPNSNGDVRDQPSPSPKSGNRIIDEPATVERCRTEYINQPGARLAAVKDTALQNSKRRNR